MKRREFITLFGGAAAWPLKTRAQQPAMPVIGYLSVRTLKAERFLLAAFRQGLGAGGFYAPCSCMAYAAGAWVYGRMRAAISA
jgi:putative ABC transport system substrate-binding protein